MYTGKPRADHSKVIKRPPMKTRKPRLSSTRRGSTTKLPADRRYRSTLEKMRVALEMRIEAYSLYDIGQTLGVTEARASQLLKKSLAFSTAEIEQLGNDLRTLELERLDRLILAWYKPAKRDTYAAAILLKYIERRHKIIPGMEITKNDVTSGGKPITVTSNIDITLLSDEELAWYERIITKAGPKVDLTGEKIPKVIEHKPRSNDEDE